MPGRVHSKCLIAACGARAMIPLGWGCDGGGGGDHFQKYLWGILNYKVI